MASVDKTVSIIFNADDNISKTLRTIKRDVRNFSRDLDDLGDPFADAAQKVLLLQTAIVGLAGVGITAANEIQSASLKMQASLGLPTEEVERFEDIAKKVYTSGYGEDLAASFEAVTLAQKKFGDNAEEDIGKVAKQALKLQKIFGDDYQEYLTAASSLTKDFGITSQQAFDFITVGYQKGLNSSGDFLDSIKEYGVQFSSGGANASQFFSVLETGFKEGVLGTDKAADQFKEFRVRIQDGSKATREALSNIGIDNDALQKSLNTGEISVADAFQKIQQAIKSTSDSSVAFQAGVGLFGTQFEDLGNKAGLSLDLTKTKIEDLQGALDKVDTRSFGSKIESSLRKVRLAITDTKGLGGIGDSVADILEDIATNFEIAFKEVDLEELEIAFKEVLKNIEKLFDDLDLDVTTVEGMRNAINLAVDSIESLTRVTAGIVEVITPIITTGKELLEIFNSLDNDTKDLIGKIVGFGTALSVLGGVVAIGGVLLSGLGTLASLLSVGSGIGAAVAGVGLLVAGLVKEFKGLNDQVDKSNEKLSKSEKLIFKIPEKKFVDVEVSATGEDAKEIQSLLKKKQQAEIDIKLKSDKIKEVKKEIDKLPVEKELELKLKGQLDQELEKIKTQADTVQTALEWQAKIDIADAESSAKIIEASFKTIGETIKSSGDLVGDVFSTLRTGFENISDEWAAKRLLDEETARRQQLFELQEKQIEAELRLTELKAQKMQEGKAQIEISSQGLEPALEMIMWNVIEKVQIRATEEASEFLLGI